MQSRISARLRALGLSTLDEYLDLLRGEHRAKEFAELVDGLTTNQTSFFREVEHFRFLQHVVLPSVTGRGEAVRIWSAGCSTGEEAYTIAMILRQTLPPEEAERGRIYASDVSAHALRRAFAGEYHEERMARVPVGYRTTHFVHLPQGTWRVNDATRALVDFAELDLMDDWPMRDPFDAVFCRNVLINFDRPTQERLVQRCAQALRPGGFLFVGLSESLSGIDHGLRYVQPAVYIK